MVPGDDSPETRPVDPLIDRVHLALAAATAGRGRALVVTGDPGSGKTRALASVIDAGRAAGALVLTAEGAELEQPLGLGVARQLFEQHLAGLTPERRQAVSKGPAGLAFDALGTAASGSLSELQVRHGLYWMAVALAEDAPVLLVVDDAQWADDATLGWIAYLTHRIGTSRIVVVLAARTDLLSGPGSLVGAIAGQAASEVLDVVPLDIGAVDRILHEHGLAGADPAFVTACDEWTGGNALFTTELAAELARIGVAPREDEIPRLQAISLPSVATMTTDRLSRLRPDARSLAAAVAVLGADAELRHAAELSGLDLTAAAAAADNLAEARLLRRGLPLRFIHPVVAASTYAEGPAAGRALEHLRAAEILAAAGAPDSEIAVHLLRGPAVGDADAADLLLRVAKADLDRGAPHEAAVLAERALAEPPALPSRGPGRLLLGQALALAGDPRAIEVLAVALDEQDDPASRAVTGYLLGRMMLFAGHQGEALRILEPLAATLPAGDDLAQRIEASYLAAVHASVDATGIGGRLQQMRVAADPASPGGRLLCGQLAVHETRTGRSRNEALRYAREGLADGRLLAESPDAPDAHVIPTSMLALCDELDEARAGYDAAFASARRNGSIVTFATTATFASWAAYLCGDLEQAELWCRDVLRIAEEAPALAALPGFALAHLVVVLVEQGRLDEAAGVLASADAGGSWSEGPSTADLLTAGAWLAEAQGRHATAAVLLRRCGALQERAGVRNPSWTPWRSQLALALLANNERAEARSLAADELALAREFGARRALGVAIRTVALVGDDDVRVELLAESVEVLRGSSARLDLARSLVALGTELGRARQRAAGRAALSEARDIAERCGALRIVALAEAELGSSFGRRAAYETGSAALTPSERRVCEMASVGMSNPEIAQALFVTRATVESHLHAAYRKLGIDRRAHLPSALGGP
ncbi:MAG TPA: AAA family ATPase [Marmoricola sp.]|jgi:DNA-binding CsgD family transcriptional regulator|nr:AAA family ATPase [Marmoricola sp.]